MHYPEDACTHNHTHTDTKVKTKKASLEYRTVSSLYNSKRFLLYFGNVQMYCISVALFYIIDACVYCTIGTQFHSKRAEKLSRCHTQQNPYYAYTRYTYKLLKIRTHVHFHNHAHLNNVCSMCPCVCVCAKITMIRISYLFYGLTQTHT